MVNVCGGGVVWGWVGVGLGSNNPSVGQRVQPAWGIQGESRPERVTRQVQAEGVAMWHARAGVRHALKCYIQ